MTQEEVNWKLELHKKWLNRELDGEIANFSRCNLIGINLENVNLNGANLNRVNLKNANLNGTNLEKSNLKGANLEGANLTGANLEGANLTGANFAWANLEGTNLKNAILQDAILIETKNIPNIPMACPEKGSFTAWKKVYYYLIELLIPEDARRSSSTSNKCRCDKAKVISITNLYTNKKVDSIVNYNFHITEYKVGEMVYPDSFDENRWKECSNGIHFFMNKQDAINY